MRLVRGRGEPIETPELDDPVPRSQIGRVFWTCAIAAVVIYWAAFAVLVYSSLTK